MTVVVQNPGNVDIGTVADINAAGIRHTAGTAKSDETEIVDPDEFPVYDLRSVIEHTAAINDHICAGSTGNGQILACGAGAGDTQLFGVYSGTDQDRVAGSCLSEGGVDLSNGFGGAAAVIGVVAFGGNVPNPGGVA